MPPARLACAAKTDYSRMPTVLRDGPFGTEVVLYVQLHQKGLMQCSHFSMAQPHHDNMQGETLYVLLLCVDWYISCVMTMSRVTFITRRSSVAKVNKVIFLTRDESKQWI